jgi:hypothetical protein
MSIHPALVAAFMARPLIVLTNPDTGDLLTNPETGELLIKPEEQ